MCAIENDQPTIGHYWPNGSRAIRPSMLAHLLRQVFLWLAKLACVYACVSIWLTLACLHG